MFAIMYGAVLFVSIRVSPALWISFFMEISHLERCRNVAGATCVFCTNLNLVPCVSMSDVYLSMRLCFTLSKSLHTWKRALVSERNHNREMIGATQEMKSHPITSYVLFITVTIAVSCWWLSNHILFETQHKCSLADFVSLAEEFPSATCIILYGWHYSQECGAIYAQTSNFDNNSNGMASEIVGTTWFIL